MGAIPISCAPPQPWGWCVQPAGLNAVPGHGGQQDHVHSGSRGDSSSTAGDVRGALSPERKRPRRAVRSSPRQDIIGEKTHCASQEGGTATTLLGEKQPPAQPLAGRAARLASSADCGAGDRRRGECRLPETPQRGDRQSREAMGAKSARRGAPHAPTSLPRLRGQDRSWRTLPCPPQSSRGPVQPHLPWRFRATAHYEHQAAVAVRTGPHPSIYR